MDALVYDDDFAAYLQRDLDRVTAEIALQVASGVVREFCGWSISEETTTFVVDGSGTALLRLPTLMLTAVDAVRVDSTTIDPAEYAWSAGGLIGRRAASFVWPRRFRCVEVDATHGYAEIPDAIRAVVLSLAARYYTNPDGLRSKTVGQISRTYVIETMRGDLGQLEMALIGGYRLT